MASFEFLLTLLPSLPPNLGDKVSIEDAYRLLRGEGNSKIDYLVDLLSIEDKINNCGLQYYILDNKTFEVDLPLSLPESFCNTFLSFREKSESEWMTSVYAAWFDLIIKTGKNVGSSLLVEWAKWEYSLRISLLLNRFKRAGLEIDEAEAIPEFMRFDKPYDTDYVVDAYYKCNEPMKAEKTIDEFRLDFIRNSAISYSFSADELIAYMLELRIYARYSRLDPEKGRKILQEVTAL